MKKLFAVLLILLSLFLVGCGGDEPEAPPLNTPEILSKGTGFVVTLIRADDGSVKYGYTVTASDGSEIESAVCAYQPKVAKLKEGRLIGIRFYTDNDTFCRYYDLKEGLASQSYFGAFWDNGTLVGYNDFERSGKLIVCDIFNSDGYRYEKEIQSNAMELIVTGTSVSEDGKTLSVKFKMGESGYEQSAAMPLTADEP